MFVLLLFVINREHIDIHTYISVCSLSCIVSDTFWEKTTHTLITDSEEELEPYIRQTRVLDWIYFLTDSVVATNDILM